MVGGTFLAEHVVVSAGRPSAEQSAGAAAPAANLADQQLLAGLRDRDPAAVEALYDRHHQVAFGLALRLVRNQQIAEEVLQEAFLAAWRQAATYRAERGTLRNWLLSIVHHRAIDVLRRHDVARPPAALDDSMVDAESADVTEEAEGHMRQERVRRAIRALPADQRDAIHLAYFGGLTCQEISDRRQIPLGTVKGRMRLALQKLRVLLAPEAEWHG